MPSDPLSMTAGAALGWSLGIRGRDSWREVPLRGPVVSLGGRGSDVLVPGIERDQARLELDGATVRLALSPGAPAVSLHGVAVRVATLREGDSFRLGGVDLTLRRRATADRAASASRPAIPADPSAEVTPQILAVLDTVAHWALRGGGAACGSMLATFASVIAAEAAALLELTAPAPPRILTTWGDPRLDDDAEAILRAAAARAAEGTIGRAGDGGFRAAALRAPGGAICALCVRGEIAARDAAALPAALRLLAHGLFRERASAPPPPRARERGLVFPERIVVGRAPAMSQLYARLAALVDAPLPVLVLGETGVGKEHVARLVHDSSSRSGKPFVSINCAAIPGELLESELFGIGRGVATGVDERAGKFQQADGGTLFLDEIGELPLPLQAKLLRALEEKTVQSVGGRTTRVDLRIVAATNLDLAAVAAGGPFRLDLYHRLAGFVVEVPPLRERAADIPLLFGHFLADACGERPTIAPATVTALVRYRWPGNVRELRHEAARVAARRLAGESVEPRHLSPAIAGAAPGSDERRPLPGSLDEELERVERALIASTLASLHGNQSQTAMRLGISRERLRRRLRDLGIAVGS